MNITLYPSDFTKRHPIPYRIAKETEIPEQLIRVTPRVIVFFGYSRETVYNHFCDPVLTKAISHGTIDRPYSFRLFETKLHGCFFHEIWWYYNKEFLDEEA